jgi:beta-lactamase class A
MNRRQVLQAPFLWAASALEQDLARITAGFPGRVGIGLQAGRRTASIRGEERFSLQSVVKLLVGLAVLDAVDRRGWSVEDAVTVQRADLSVFAQPIAQRIGPDGFRTTVGELVRGAIIDSDSAACDVLIARLGGPAAVQAVLARMGAAGMRVDRDERHLQTEIVGLEWRPEFTDAGVLERAITGVPEAVRTREYQRYQRDLHDTSTPRAMAALLQRLAAGKLLSPSSTAFLWQAMRDCATGEDRLKAGSAAGWTLGHKTGTSGSWQGVTAATNDVGILTSPASANLAIAVFVADSPASASERATVIARVAAAAIRHSDYLFR